MRQKCRECHCLEALLATVDEHLEAQASRPRRRNRILFNFTKTLKLAYSQARIFIGSKKFFEIYFEFCKNEQ